MFIYISLLRGINVGGNKKIRMETLRALYDTLGLTGATSYLQSGNVVFKSSQADRVRLATQIEDAVENTFGFRVRIILRTLEELRAVVDGDSLSAGARERSKLLVMFLAGVPAAHAVEDLLHAHTGPEEIEVKGQDVYLYYPEGMGRSKLTGAWIERKLGVTGTARNWNTVSKLVELAEGLDVP